MWNDANVKMLNELWAKGHSAGGIADALGCGRSAVCAKLQRLGLRRGHKSPTAKPMILAARRRPVDIAPPPAPRQQPTRNPFERVEYTKSELRAMLAEAVRNTG